MEFPHVPSGSVSKSLVSLGTETFIRIDSVTVQTEPEVQRYSPETVCCVIYGNIRKMRLFIWVNFLSFRTWRIEALEWFVCLFRAGVNGMGTGMVWQWHKINKIEFQCKDSSIAGNLIDKHNFSSEIVDLITKWIRPLCWAVEAIVLPFVRCAAFWHCAIVSCSTCRWLVSIQTQWSSALWSISNVWIITKVMDVVND